MHRFNEMCLHELVFMIPSSVCTISTFPDLTVCLGLTHLLQTLMLCCLMTLGFCTGDFCLSFLVLSCSLFEQTVMLVVLVLHERKFATVHRVFFQQLCN